MQIFNKANLIYQWKLLNILRKRLKNNFSLVMLKNAVNQEIIEIIQRIRPNIYQITINKRQQSSIADSINSDKQERKENSMGLLPGVLAGLGPKISQKDKPAIKKWNPNILPKDTIISNTINILSALKEPSRKNKLENIKTVCNFIKENPEARHIAIKQNGINILLKCRNEEKNEEIQASINEVLALLGHSDPVKGAGIRILSIDGGGTRGLLAIEMLKKLEELANKPILEMFDLICGVSTGAIIASLLVIKKLSLEEIAHIYENIGREVFTQSTLKGTSNLVWSHSYYDTALWERLLKEAVGEETLLESRRQIDGPKLLTVSAVVNKSRLTPYAFRNYNLPHKIQSQYSGSSNHLVWEAVRASAAAPTYFEEFKLGKCLHQDGGVLVNNPTAVAIHEAKLIWGQTPLQCVISCGTGRTAPNPIDNSISVNDDSVSSSSWKNKFLALIDSATDTEAVHTILSDLLPPNTYYRFNPYLTEMLSISEINSDKIEQLKRDALMYLRRNEEKFQEAVNCLNISRSKTQKLMDWISLQRQINDIFQIGRAHV